MPAKCPRRTCEATAKAIASRSVFLPEQQGNSSALYALSAALSVVSRSSSDVSDDWQSPEILPKQSFVLDATSHFRFAVGEYTQNTLDIL